MAISGSQRKQELPDDVTAPQECRGRLSAADRPAEKSAPAAWRVIPIPCSQAARGRHSRRRQGRGCGRSPGCVLPAFRGRGAMRVARGPNLLGRQADRRRYQGFDCRPGVLQGFSGGGRMITMSERNPRKGLAPLLQGGQHISRMPVFFRARAIGGHGGKKFVFENMRKVCSMRSVATLAQRGQIKKCARSVGASIGAFVSAD